MSPKLCELSPVIMGVINAKLDPKYAGIFALVISMYNNVPTPEANNAEDIGNPVKNGTSTVQSELIVSSRRHLIFLATALKRLLKKVMHRSIGRKLENRII